MLRNESDEMLAHKKDEYLILSPAELVHISNEDGRKSVEILDDESEDVSQIQRGEMIKYLELHVKTINKSRISDMHCNSSSLLDSEEAQSPGKRNLLTASVKSMVSGDKRRLQNGNFDLDLTYVTSNVIAMSMPADKVKGLYRNSFDDVISFLEHRHLNHYKVESHSLTLYVTVPSS